MTTGADAQLLAHLQDVEARVRVAVEHRLGDVDDAGVTLGAATQRRAWRGFGAAGATRATAGRSVELADLDRLIGEGAVVGHSTCAPWSVAARYAGM